MKTSRRTVLKILGASGLTPSMALQAFDIKNNMARRIIPSTGELLPVIGLGTSRVLTPTSMKNHSIQEKIL